MADSKESREVVCGNDTCYCTGACHSKSPKINPFEYTGGDNEVKIAEDDGKPSDMTIRITADVGDALTGFKALQRELRETTKAARELEQAYEDVEKATNSSKFGGISVEEYGKWFPTFKCVNND